jgi:hypothetical protein
MARLAATLLCVDYNNSSLLRAFGATSYSLLTALGKFGSIASP